MDRSAASPLIWQLIEGQPGQLLTRLTPKLKTQVSNILTGELRQQSVRIITRDLIVLIIVTNHVVTMVILKP